jgi:tetratricopeptide (TPR) repeat protein
LELALGQLELEALHRKTGRIAEADHEHRQAIDELTKLQTDFPTVGEYRQRLASAHRDLSDSLQTMGRYQEAETANRSALRLWESLVGDFPGEDQYRLGLARTQASLGINLDSLHRYEEAKTSIQQAVTLLSRLNADHSSEVEYRQALAGAWNNLGLVLEDTERLVESREALLKSSQIHEELAARFPEILLHQKDLVAVLMNLGNIADVLGHPRESEQCYQRALAVTEKLAEVYPDVPDFHGDAASLLHNLYINRRARNEDEEARSLLEPAIHHEQAALKLQPTHHRALRLYAFHSTDLASDYVMRGDHAAASRVAEHWAHTCLAGPANSRDATGYGLVRFVEVLSDCAELAQKDDALSPAHRDAAAQSYLDRARTMTREAAPRPDDLPALLPLVDLLATAPREIRDPERALHLARQAVEREPENSAGWQSLAWALYRMGDWKGCIETIEKKADHDSCLFLAMAHWKLGNKDVARAWLRWANDWLKDYEQMRSYKWRHGLYGIPTASAWKRLQAEATELMGPIRRELEADLSRRGLALELAFARRAIELKADDRDRWEVLSWAEYRNGNWDKAIRAAEKCIKIHTDKDRVSPGLVLALAYARRGEMDQAREWYTKNRATNAPWRLFDTPRWLIDEASRLFGKHESAIFEESKTTPKTGTESK